MKKISFILACLISVPALANEYGSYESYDSYDSYDSYSADTNTRDNYVGLRIHKNESLSLKYNINSGGNTTVRKDNFGFGAIVGNKLTSNVKIEFETAYTGVSKNKRNNEFDFDIWSNMLNVYLFKEYENVVAPYAGVGLGFASIWGDVNSPAGRMSDNVFDLSYQLMVGINFALNDRVDLNVGLKYQYYGEVEHQLHNTEYAVTDVDATEVYFGVAYKFGLK